MANEINMTTYLNNRLKYHTASRVATQEDESLGQALNLDTHTVTSQKVWSSPLSGFPVNSPKKYKETKDGIGASQNLVSIFKENGSSEEFKGGYIWTNPNYPNVRLFENVSMSPVEGSDGENSANEVVYQSYEVLSGNQRIQDWVSPMAVFDSSNGKPVPGYTVRIMAKNEETALWNDSSISTEQDIEKIQGTDWALSKGTWEFIYNAGIVTFEKDHTPMGARISTTSYDWISIYWKIFR